MNNSTRTLPARQRGQSMVEYVIVVVFCLLVLTSDPAVNVIKQLLDAMKNNYRGYSYAVSLSDWPDASTLEELKALLKDQAVKYGKSNDEIAAMLLEKANPPEPWLAAYKTFVGDKFPDPGDFPSINPADYF
jgi:hypothetical protein